MDSAEEALGELADQIGRSVAGGDTVEGAVNLVYAIPNLRVGAHERSPRREARVAGPQGRSRGFGRGRHGSGIVRPC